MAYAAGRVKGLASKKTFEQAAQVLLPFFAGHTVGELTEDLLRDYVAYRVAAGVKESTTAREIDDLQSAVNWCVKNRKLDSRPFQMWRPKKPDPKDRWLTKHEAACLVAASLTERQARSHLVPFVLIALRTGQRASKILALQWTPNTTGGHVDLAHGMIYFQPMGKAQTPKKAAKMPIPRSLRQLLTILHTRNTVYVIADAGQPVKSVKKSFANACRKAGLDDVTPHTLKHTAVSWMLQAGHDPWAVAGFIGTSLPTLMRVYGHHCKDKMRALADAL